MNNSRNVRQENASNRRYDSAFAWKRFVKPECSNDWVFQKWLFYFPGKVIVAFVTNNTRKQHMRNIPQRFLKNMLTTG